MNDVAICSCSTSLRGLGEFIHGDSCYFAGKTLGQVRAEQALDASRAQVAALQTEIARLCTDLGAAEEIVNFRGHGLEQYAKEVAALKTEVADFQGSNRLLTESLRVATFENAGKIEEKNEAIDNQKAITARIQREFDTFKDLVREVALDAQQQENWCDEGLNTALGRLGLPLKTRKYTVRVEVEVYKTIDVEVEAASEDEAMEAVTDEAVEQALENEDVRNFDGMSHESKSAF